MLSLLESWERKTEQRRWAAVPCIAEPLNTVSNALFSLLAVVRLAELSAVVTPLHPSVPTLYKIMFAAGICSAIHHGTTPKWTIVIDYIPIVSGVGLGLYVGVLHTTTWGTLTAVAFAFAVLLSDHVWTPIPVPWGHCFWHFLAALAFDRVIWDFHTATTFAHAVDV